MKTLFISLVLMFMFVNYACARPTQPISGDPISADEPTTNMDGSPLTDLAGYKIYCGVQPRTTVDYPTEIDLGMLTPVAGRVDSILRMPTAGTYYCAWTAYDSSGYESDYSVEIIKTITGVSLSDIPGSPKNIQ